MRQLLSDIALIPDDHRRGKTFERAVKWLLENAPETRNQFKKVWLWDDYPDREGRDLGIDLVAETLQGTRWAIQAKCYGPDQSLTWGDLSTFYGDAIGRKEIDQLLLVTTTDRISPNAKKKLDQSSKPSAIWQGLTCCSLVSTPQYDCGWAQANPSGCPASGQGRIPSTATSPLVPPWHPATPSTVLRVLSRLPEWGRVV